MTTSTVKKSPTPLMPASANSESKRTYKRPSKSIHFYLTGRIHVRCEFEFEEMVFSSSQCQGFWNEFMRIFFQARESKRL